MSVAGSGVQRKTVLLGQQLKCKNGCGYFGNPEWQGYCSKCHKELHQKGKTEPVVKSSGKKVSRSYSDVQDSSLSLKFSKFEEKKKQHAEKRTKTIKSIMKRGHTSKDSVTHSPSRELFSLEEITELCKEFLLKEAAVKDIIKQINTQLDIMYKHYDKPIDEQSEIMQEFYNFMTHRFETHAHYQELSSEQLDALLDKIEQKLMHLLHRNLFQMISTEYEEKDLALQKRIRSLNWITAQRLGLDIRENSPEIRNLIDKAITDVSEMDSKKAPQEKISCIVNCSKNILNIINLCQGVTVSADEFLPAMVCMVLKANPPLMQSNMKYITSYSIPARLRSGEGAYYFTNLCCAVEFIEKMTSDALNLSNEEFERYLAGEVPVDYTEQSITTCEGFRLMTQNLATLTEIQERSNKVLDDMMALKEEIINTEEILLKRKSTAPLIINPKPYKIPSHVDMSLIPEILRDRVVIEESGEILVDLNTQEENDQNIAPDSSIAATSSNETHSLADFQDISFPNGSSDGHIVIKPLQVNLPVAISNCDLISGNTADDSSLSAITIRDLEYPNEIFPKTGEEVNPNVNSSNLTNDNLLIDPMTDESGLMEEQAPPLSLPPPLLPVVVKSEQSDNEKTN